MANKQVFKTTPNKFVPSPAVISKLTSSIPVADTVNKAGGLAYSLESEQALAQMVFTSTFRDSANGANDGVEQVHTILGLVSKVSPQFHAQCAIASRSKGLMKDAPALLLAALMVRDGDLFARVFPVMAGSDLRFVRDFVQVVRSGVVGRKSFGTRPRRLIREFLERLTPEQLFRQSIGTNPSLADLIRMVHPRDVAKQDFYGYILGNKVVHSKADMKTRAVNKAGVSVRETVLYSDLPLLVRQYETYKANPEGTAMPSVPYEMLTAMATTNAQWVEIAQKATWKQTIKNLVAFQRHGVFSTPEMVDFIADRIQNPQEVRKSKMFPYQLLMAYDMAQENSAIPRKIVDAVKAAMNVSTENVPCLQGNVYVFVDVSGSMNSSVTGYKVGATSKVTCRMVSALIASCIAKTNAKTTVMPFSDRLYLSYKFDPSKDVIENTAILRALPSGGTDCSLPLNHLAGEAVSHGEEPVTCIFVSDNESWMGPRGRGHATRTMSAWTAFKALNPNAKLVCIDLSPNTTTQAPNSQDIMNIGGWGDNNFSMIDLFARGEEYGSNHWVNEIKKIELTSKDVGTSMSLTIESEAD